MAQPISESGAEAFGITVYGAGESELSDSEKEQLAESIHRILQENFDVHPDSVGIEGYGE